ncbi:hypothetical protein KKH36_02350 [Patescibacteria group bacterium]|nr:hypothetical protein [Patescibacteria group bacterium]
MNNNYKLPINLIKKNNKGRNTEINNNKKINVEYKEILLNKSLRGKLFIFISLKSFLKEIIAIIKAGVNQIIPLNFKNDIIGKSKVIIGSIALKLQRTIISLPLIVQPKNKLINNVPTKRITGTKNRILNIFSIFIIIFNYLLIIIYINIILNKYILLL